MIQTHRRKILATAAAAAIAGLVVPAGSALAAYPDKQVTLVVPYAGGGMGSVFANMVGEILTDQLKQPVVPDYRPGANATLGTDAVAKAAPDGYTLLMVTTSSLTINPTFRKNIRYDPIKDFTPVSMVWIARNVLYTPPQTKTLKQLIDAGISKSLTYGSLGPGSLAHFSSEMLVREAKLQKPVHVPFKGNGQVMTEVTAGRVDFAFGDASGLQLAEAGRVNAIAVTGDKRIASAPKVPTMAELGYPNVGTASWIGIVAPAGTPKAIVDRISQALSDGFKSEAVRAKVTAVGVEVADDLTPGHFDKTIKSDLVRWKKFQQETQITIE